MADQSDGDRTECFNTSFASEDDPRVLQLSQAYLADLEAGRSPDRETYLSRYPELRSVLEECLEGVELAHAMGAAKSVPRDQSAEFASQPLGDFRIIREIGRGGMGTVYEAVQLSLGRRVALKVLPFAAAMDERQRQRFQLEAHAAAQLHHNHIVPVFAVGCDRGTHYYAMQLINGDTVATLIEHLRRESASSTSASVEHRTASGKKSRTNSIATNETRSKNASTTIAEGRTGASWATRGSSLNRYQSAARLIAQIADALDYAHSSGIIHRDIKPANILIDASGNGWITDFGLAQVTANSALTQTGDLVGTLRYMSPEQAAGKRWLVDHRTDIYSLGATLYELISLRPIFVGDDRQSLLHSLLQIDPPMLRSHDRAIPIELETIVHKSLAKLPADRYATAGEFAADLRRFIEERPIKARRPTLIDHARKWGRRHPAIVTMTLIGLFVGVIGLAIGMAAISNEQSKTQQALNREQLRAAEAEKRLRIAQKAADDMISIAEFELSDNPFEDGLRKKLLESAVAQYQTFIEEQASNPAAQANLAETRDRVQKILADLALLESLRESHLLSEPDVLADLETTEVQNQAILDWMMETSRKIGTILRSRNLSSATAQASMLSAAAANQSRLQEILTTTQARRLKQLALQVQGIKAFHESEVIKALNLTDEQRTQFRILESDLRFKSFAFGGGPPVGNGPPQPVLSSPPQPGLQDRGPQPSPQDREPRQFGAFPRDAFGPDNPGPDRPRNFREPNRAPERKPNDGLERSLELANSEAGRDILQKYLALLSAEQLQVWNALIGEPFAGQFTQFRFPRPH